MLSFIKSLFGGGEDVIEDPPDVVSPASKGGSSGSQGSSAHKAPVPSDGSPKKGESLIDKVVGTAAPAKDMPQPKTKAAAPSKKKPQKQQTPQKGKKSADAPTGSASDRYQKLRQKEVRINVDAPPEELCGITKGMAKEQIEERLTMLYRRHNAAASSLDENLRSEAEVMLDAVVELRKKHFG